METPNPDAPAAEAPPETKDPTPPNGVSKDADPSGPLADAVKGALGDAAAQEAAKQAAAVRQMREAQAAAFRTQQRLQIATVLCGGICAGYYSNPDKFVAGFGDSLTDKALEWADQLIAKAGKLPAAANG